MIRNVCGQNLFYGGGLDVNDTDGVGLLQGYVGLAVLGGDVLRLEVDRGLGIVAGWAEDAHALR